MYQLRVKGHFDAAHQLVGHEGKCSRVHGHRWIVEVCIEGSTLDRLNMLIDFSKVKNQLQSTIDQFLDHHMLNETLEVSAPTAEYLAKWLYEDFRGFDNYIKSYGGRKGLKVSSVTIWESPKCSITYSPPR